MADSPTTTYPAPAPHRFPGDDYARLLNANKAFEGGGLLPPPGGGFQIPPVTNFRVAKVEPHVGGVKVTLSWLAESLEVNDKVQLQVWTSLDAGRISSLTNPNDISFSNLVSYGSASIFADAPGEIFIPATSRFTAVITAATVHSSGVITRKEFQPTVTVEVSPLGSYQEYHAAAFTISATRSTTYLVDTTAGATVCTLPPVKSTPPGMVVIVKKITADGNILNITPAAGETIDGAGAFNDATAYAKFMVTSDHRNTCWWKII